MHIVVLLVLHIILYRSGLSEGDLAGFGNNLMNEEIHVALCQITPAITHTVQYYSPEKCIS